MDSAEALSRTYFRAVNYYWLQSGELSLSKKQKQKSFQILLNTSVDPI